MELFCAYRGESPKEHQSHKKILNSIPSPKLLAILLLEDQQVACGVGLLMGNHFGFFDLLTDPEHRGKGFGTELVLGMLCWTQERDAHLAYLQVVEKNEAAKGLYRKLGFKKTYSYWYRVINKYEKDV